jgi:hypothetical protein
MKNGTKAIATIRDFMVKSIATKDESIKDESDDGDKDLTSWFVNVPFVIKVHPNI